jgi:amino acid transporter
MSALFSALAYLSVSSSSSVVFSWLLNFTNTAGFISWVCCMIVYIRFRKAASAQGVELPYKSKMQPWGAYVGMCGATFLLLVNGFTVFFPSQWSVSNFFTSYIGIPAFLVIYAGHRLFYWRDPWAWEPMDVDMQTGLDEIMTAEKPPRAYDTWYKKLMILIE